MEHYKVNVIFKTLHNFKTTNPKMCTLRANCLMKNSLSLTLKIPNYTVLKCPNLLSTYACHSMLLQSPHSLSSSSLDAIIFEKF